jgi:hypothetical protein
MIHVRCILSFASSRGPVHRSTLVTGDVDGNGLNEFFVTMGQRLMAIGRIGKGCETKSTVTSPSEKPPVAVAASDSRVLVELHAESGTIQLDGASAQLHSHYRKGNFLTTPTVADLDGDGRNEIIVCTADGYLNVLK